MSRKLLIVTPLYPPDVGGPATHSIFAETNLPKRGFEIKRVYFGDYLHYPYIIRHIILSWHIIRASKNIDTIYALDTLGVGLPAMLIAKLLNKRAVVRVPGDRAWEIGVQKHCVTESLDIFATIKFYSLPIWIYKLAQLITVKLADRIIVPSNYLAKIVNSWGANKAKIAVIPSAYSPAKVGDNQDLRKKYSVDGLRVISAGRLVSWKGFALLLQIWPDVLRRHPSARLDILGDGPERVSLESLITKLDVEKSVRLHGNVGHQEVLERLKMADLFVLNSGYEGLSHQILECMDMGTPVITTKVGGNSELIENDMSGLLVASNNGRELLGAIDNLLSNKTLADDMAVVARESLKSFDREAIADKLAKSL